MVLNKNRRIKVQGVSFSMESTFYYMNSLPELEGLLERNMPIFESDNDFFIVKAFSVFRFVKPESAPRILKVQKLEVNPDAYAVKVQLSREALFDFARRESLFIFETEDCYVLPSSIYLFALKKEKEHGREVVSE